MLSWISIVLAHWNNNPMVEVSPQSSKYQLYSPWFYDPGEMLCNMHKPMGSLKVRNETETKHSEWRYLDILEHIYSLNGRGRRGMILFYYYYYYLFFLEFIEWSPFVSIRFSVCIFCFVSFLSLQILFRFVVFRFASMCFVSFRCVSFLFRFSLYRDRKQCVSILRMCLITCQYNISWSASTTFQLYHGWQIHWWIKQ